jgi:hypothetical protein
VCIVYLTETPRMHDHRLALNESGVPERRQYRVIRKCGETFGHDLTFIAAKRVLRLILCKPIELPVER